MKTYVKRRLLCPAAPLLGSKIGSGPPPGAHQMLAGLAFQPHNGQQTVLLCSNAVHADFSAHIVLKHQKPLFSE